NKEFIKEFYNNIIDLQAEGRMMYFDTADPHFITTQMQNSKEFKNNMEYLRSQLNKLLEKLNERTVPFWSPRYMGHMVTETTMPSNLGYVAALQYNQNNIATEGSPLTTLLEVDVGNQLCGMLGFNIANNLNINLDNLDQEDENIYSFDTQGIQSWGHITCDGQLSFIGKSFTVELANGLENKLLKDCTTWELLNLKPTTVLNIPERLYQNTPVDIAARMDVKELDKELAKCVRNQQAVYAVVAIMGSTEQGACDPLADIVALRDRYQRRYGLSFVIHADAAWGGYFRTMLVEPPKNSPLDDFLEGYNDNEEHDTFVPMLALNPYTRKHLYSLKDCDSVTIDPHKSGYIPFPAGGLCYRDQRMRYLVTWTSPVVTRPKEESMGIYGVEGSKPGAAPVAAWLSHDVIGLHQRGYGALLGQATFTCSKIYCYWATMSTDKDNFIVIPFNMLPAEKLNPPNLKEVKQQKQKIRELIVTKSNLEIIMNEEALNLIKQNRLGLKGNQDLYVLINVVMNPWPTEFDFITALTNTFKETLKELAELSAMRNTITPIHFNRIKSAEENQSKDKSHNYTTHLFIIQGTDEIYLVHLPLFQLETHRFQVIIKAEIPERIMYEYKNFRKKNPSKVLLLCYQENITIDQIATEGNSFKAYIIENFDPYTRNLGLSYQDADYPIDRIPFYIYGTKNQLHIEHLLLKSPSIQLSAENVRIKLTSGTFTKEQKKKGAIVHIIAKEEDGIIINLSEAAMQPFPDTKYLGDPFFFKANSRFHVELYEDPVCDPALNGPGLDNVNCIFPFATGKIILPPVREGSLYIDSHLINADPIKIKNDGIVKCTSTDSWKKCPKQSLVNPKNNWYEKDYAKNIPARDASCKLVI
ncbi:17081_t:CDS:2, partial [Racocetra fulgida]